MEDALSFVAEQRDESRLQQPTGFAVRDTADGGEDTRARAAHSLQQRTQKTPCHLAVRIVANLRSFSDFPCCRSWNWPSAPRFCRGDGCQPILVACGSTSNFVLAQYRDPHAAVATDSSECLSRCVRDAAFNSALPHTRHADCACTEHLCA